MAIDIDALLNRLTAGGMHLTVIPVTLEREATDPTISRALTLLEQIMEDEKTVQMTYKLMNKRGYTDKAEALKAWWSRSTGSADELIDQLTSLKEEEADKTTVIELLTKLNDVMEPLVKEVHDRVEAIRERQIIGMCEVDIEDLLV